MQTIRRIVAIAAGALALLPIIDGRGFTPLPPQIAYRQIIVFVTLIRRYLDAFRRHVLPRVVSTPPAPAYEPDTTPEQITTPAPVIVLVETSTRYAPSEVEKSIAALVEQHARGVYVVGEREVSLLPDRIVQS